MEEALSKREDLIDFLINKGNGVKGLSQLNLDRIPDQFILPPEERLNKIQVATQQSIPIIDVSKWDVDPKVSESICDAAAKWGFFQIINHGIPIEVLENVKKAAHNFFELPVEERINYLKENSPTPTVVLKTSFSPYAEKVLEWKDYLFHIATKQNEASQFWPPVSRDEVLEYVNLARPVIRKLLEVLLNGINVKQIDEVKESSLMDTLLLTLLQYPRCPNPDLAAGAGPHSDVSSITLLLQDDVGGLYVRDCSCSTSEGNRWIHVVPVEGSLVVNIGDALQIMSNDRYKSIEHRVYLVSNKDRVSVPIFANPARDAVIGPLPEALEVGDKPIYKQVVFGDYFDYFFSKGHEGKDTLDYVKL